MKIAHVGIGSRIHPYLPFTALNTVWRKLDRQAESILDVGCGKGEVMKFINRGKKFYAVGVDIFKPYVQESRKLGCYDEVILADIRNLSFKPKSFDIVLAIEVLEHLEKEEGERLLQAMQEVARKQVILTTPVGEYKQDAYNGNPHQEHKSSWYPIELKQAGYAVTNIGIHGLRLPRGFSFITPLLGILAGPVVHVLPKLGGRSIAVKKLDKLT